MKNFFKTAITILILLHLILNVFPIFSFASVESIEQEINSLNEQIVKIETEKITDQEELINNNKEAVQCAEKVMEKFQNKYNDMHNKLLYHKGKLRILNGEIFKLSCSYEDFFNAKNIWESSSDEDIKRSKFNVMWRYLYGYEKDPTFEIYPENQNGWVEMATYVVTRRAVARIGEALVLIGELGKKIFETPTTVYDAVIELTEIANSTVFDIIPEDKINTINDYGNQYNNVILNSRIKAQLIVDNLKKIANREEFGNEDGRIAALEEARKMFEIQGQIVVKLTEELEDFASNKAIIDNNSKEIIYKHQQELSKLSDLYAQKKSLQQQLIQKRYELIQAEANEENEWDGNARFAKSLSLGISPDDLVGWNTPRPQPELPDLLNIALNSMTSALYPESQSNNTKMPMSAGLILKGIFLTTIHDEDCGNECICYKDLEYNTTLLSKEVKIIQEPVKDNDYSVCLGEINVASNKISANKPGKINLRASVTPKYDGMVDIGGCLVCNGSGPLLSDNNIQIIVHSIEAASFVPKFITYKYDWAGKEHPNCSILENMKTDLDVAISNQVDLFVPPFGSFNTFYGKVLYCSRSTLTPQTGAYYIEEASPKYFLITGNREGLSVNNKEFKITAQKTSDLISVLPVFYDAEYNKIELNEINICGNKVSLEILSADEPIDYTDKEDSEICIELFKPIIFQVQVHGLAEMNHYHVKWDFEIERPLNSGPGPRYIDLDDDGKDKYSEKTYFDKKNGIWLSTNTIQFNHADYYNRLSSVSFRILRNYDNLSVAYKNVRFKNVINGKKFIMTFPDSTVQFTGQNFFIRKDQFHNNVNEVNIKLDLGDGNYVKVFPSILKNLLFYYSFPHSETIGHIEYDPYIITNGDQAIEMSLSSLNQPIDFNVGIHSLDDADKSELLDEGIIVENDRFDHLSRIALNYLNVVHRTTDKGGQYVLQVCGPSNLENYSAKWTMEQEEILQTRFVKKGKYFESIIPSNTYLVKVEVISPDGIIKGSYLSSNNMNGRPDNEKSLSIMTESSLTYDNTISQYIHQLESIDIYPLNQSYGIIYQAELENNILNGNSGIIQCKIGDLSVAAFQNISYITNDRDTTVTLELSNFNSNKYIPVIETQPNHGAISIIGKTVKLITDKNNKTSVKFSIRLDECQCSMNRLAFDYLIAVEIDFSMSFPVIKYKNSFFSDMYGDMMLRFSVTDSYGLAYLPEISQIAEYGTINIIENYVSYMPDYKPSDNAYYNGSDQFQVIFQDEDKNSKVETNISVQVTTSQAITKKINQGGKYRFMPCEIIDCFYENNFYVEVKKIKVTSQPETGYLNFNGNNLAIGNEIDSTDFGLIQYVAEPDYTGQISFEIKGYGNDNWYGPITISLDVIPAENWFSEIPINYVPGINGDPGLKAFVDTEYVFSPVVYDKNDDPFQFSIGNNPDWLGFNAETGELKGIPIPIDQGYYEKIQLKVTDQHGDYSILPDFSIFVDNYNDNQVIIDPLDLIYIEIENNNEEVIINENICQENGSILSGPFFGTASFISGQILYIPQKGFRGIDTLTLSLENKGHIRYKRFILIVNTDVLKGRIKVIQEQNFIRINQSDFIKYTDEITIPETIKVLTLPRSGMLFSNYSPVIENHEINMLNCPLSYERLKNFWGIDLFECIIFDHENNIWTEIKTNVININTLQSITGDYIINGDFNKDEIIDLRDSILCLKIFSNCPVHDVDFTRDDLDGNHKIDFVELLFVLQYIAGIHEL